MALRTRRSRARPPGGRGLAGPARRGVSPPRGGRCPADAVALDDGHWIDEALREARAAGAAGEVPVGALVVLGDRLLARAGNRTIRDRDPAGHAEVVALRAAARAAGNHRLPGAVLYVTVEPCAMCVGAAIQARVARLVYGCADAKAGAAGTLFDLAADPRLNHRIAVTAGVREAACREVLQAFFRARRGPRS